MKKKGNRHIIFFLLGLILLLGFFLRFYRIEEIMLFHGELGDNYLQIKNLVVQKKIPLTGPPTSHAWLFFGPLFYWIFGPILLLSGFDPRSGTYFSEIIGIFTVLLNFFIISKLFGNKTALISSLLVAVSPIFLVMSRSSRFYSLVIPLSYIYYYLAYKIITKNANNWTGLILGLIMGMMINFHYAALILVPGTMLLLFKYHPRTYLKTISFYISGIFMLIFPLFLYSVLTDRTMLVKLFIWFPYRIFRFFNIFIQWKANPNYIYNSFSAMIGYVNSGFLARDYFFSIIIFLALVSSLIYLLYRGKNFSLKNLSVHLLSGLFLLLLHTDPPIHYFVAIIQIPIIVISFFLAHLNRFYFLTIFFIVFIFFSYLNSSYFFSSDWFYLPQNMVVPNKIIPYKLQLKIAQAIIDDAKGREYNLARVGDFDYYDYHYAQNYRYLLWWLGKEPEDKPTGLTYTIFDSLNNAPKNMEKKEVIFVSNIPIVKTYDANYK